MKKTLLFSYKIKYFGKNKKRNTVIKKADTAIKKKGTAIKKRDMHSSFLCIRVYKNKRNINNISNISGSKINNRIANLSKSIKVKKSFSTGFLTSKASLIFILL